jgi:hypothetical protein
MRATWIRLRTGSQAAAREVFKIEQELEALTDERRAALKDSYKTGTEPELPSQDKRRKQLETDLRAAKERARALMQATVEFLDETQARITARREQWLADLDAIEAERQATAERARQVLAEAEAELGKTARLRHWIDRTGGSAAQLVQDHFPYSQIAVGAPQDGPAHDEWIRDHMRQQFSVPAGSAEPRADIEDDASAHNADAEAIYQRALAAGELWAVRRSEIQEANHA